MRKIFLPTSIVYVLTVLLMTLFTKESPGQAAPIFAAVRNNDMVALREQLEKGADVNALDDDSDNVLINAVLYASIDCIQLLLEKNARPNIKNKCGQTALMFCVQDTVRMKLLLKYGADINASSASKNTPLLIACLGSNRLQQIKFLLRNGADPFVKNAGGASPLLRTAELGDTLSLRLFINMGLNINENPWGFTPMMAATRMANWPIVDFLLHQGADPNIPDPVNMSVLLWAAALNQTKLVNKLLEKKHNINGIDSIARMTPLMWATINEYDNPQIIQALIDKGANVNATARDGSTALSWAMKKGNTKTVAVLRKAGALDK